MFYNEPICSIGVVQSSGNQCTSHQETMEVNLVIRIKVQLALGLYTTGRPN